MSKRMLFTGIVSTFAFLMLAMSLIMPNQTVEAGGCDFLETGIIESETVEIIEVFAVGKNRVLIEIAGEPETEFRVQIGGSSLSGSFDDDGNSIRLFRNYPEDGIGDVFVAVSSFSGDISYAIDTTNCDDVDSEDYGEDIPLEETDLLLTEDDPRFGVAYYDESGIYLYRFDAEEADGEEEMPTNIGTLAVSATAEDLEDIAECPDEDTEIAVSEDELFSIYRLTSCEYQILMGPDEDGKTKVLVFESLETPEYAVDEVEFSQPQ